MKHLIVIACLFTAIILLIGCGKEKAKNPGGTGGKASAYFFENTEWTGVMNSYGQEYQQPCYLRFNGDTTVSVYALFYWVLDGVHLSYYDSAVGKITSIDTLTQGMTTVKVNFTFTSDQQVYTITNKKTLKGGSIATSTAFYYNVFSPTLELCPAVIPSIAGSTWKTDKITGLGPAAGMNAYPDLNDFSFSSDGSRSTIYYRNGKIVTFTDPTQVKQYVYYQFGSRVYFAGYNETTDKLIPYFGVLSPDGKTIWADSRNHTDGRLPNYLQTHNWYGDAGTTPNTHKQ
jgi:hypothetical protein